MSQSEFVAGNYSDKYSTHNPVARRLMKGYFRAFDRVLEGLVPANVLEVGCGEGFILQRLHRRFPGANLAALDLSHEMSRQAASLVERVGVVCASAEDIPVGDHTFDLVVCVEVLEHLVRPDGALAELRRVAKRHVLVSVPNEPLWRLLNLARGAYVSHLGNTPGHIQHWSPSEFRRLISSRFDILALKSPLPWTMALCAVPGT